MIEKKVVGDLGKLLAPSDDFSELVLFCTRILNSS